MSKQVIPGTLVLVAPQNALSHEARDVISQACTVHNGPVIVLPHNWAAMPVEFVRAQLDAIESCENTQNIGASKPPPPPPPASPGDYYARPNDPPGRRRILEHATVDE